MVEEVCENCGGRMRWNYRSRSWYCPKCEIRHYDNPRARGGASGDGWAFCKTKSHRTKKK